MQAQVTFGAFDLPLMITWTVLLFSELRLEDQSALRGPV